MAANTTSWRRNGPPRGVRVEKALAMLLATTSMRSRSAEAPAALILVELRASSKAMRVLRILFSGRPRGGAESAAPRAAAKRKALLPCDGAALQRLAAGEDLHEGPVQQRVLVEAGHLKIDVHVVAVGALRAGVVLDDS